MAAKRPRQDLDDLHEPASSASPAPLSQPAKYARSSHSPPPALSPSSRSTKPSTTTTAATTAATDARHTITCTLPSCPQREHATTEAYETHYGKHHINRCTDCAKNFPTARILECHIRENHDMFAVLALERGEKIYACFIEDCDKVCISPGKRRAHLIAKHYYHKNFNFFVVNDGIDRATSLLAASPQRKSRTRVRRVSESSSSAAAGAASTTSPTSTPNASVHALRRPQGKQANRQDRNAADNMDIDETSTPKGARVVKKHTRSASEPAADTTPVSGSAAAAASAAPADGDGEDTEMSDLTARMDAVRFVPPSVRFGRRGGGGGFSKR
ncbi:hypothetical protein DRE_05162 [Drechslerella stenobrocha 248]|uniref:C2H2-type domain-containing protein n=1 Tax=Drechslerella stenobrocha 248 TaxID=1043628 RepID=W7HNI4_9PEZI|nr:hypothetical protein DRE_05162 [Drechslerella stenobrocha 248]